MKTTLNPFENAKRTANGTGGGVSPSVIEEIQAEISVLGSQNETQAQDIIDIKGSLNSINDNLTNLINKVSYQSVDISAITKYADIQDLITASIANNKCPYIIGEFNLSGTIQHGVRLEYGRSGFGNTNNYDFGKAIDSSSVFTIEVTTTETIARIGSTRMTFTDAKLYY